MTKARSLSDFIESDGSVTLVDNQKIKVGTGNDLQIYHDGTSSYIVNTTNDLILQDDSRIRLRTPSLMVNNAADTENLLTATENGAVTLYYDNSPKLATTSNGVDVTGVMTASAGITSSAGTVQFSDGGASFDSSDSSGYPVFKQTNGSAQLALERTGSATGKGYIGADSASLFHVYNSSFAKKFDISTDGNVNVTGSLTSGGNISIDAPSGNPEVSIKTAGAGNNPSVAYRAGNNIVFDNMLVASASTDYWRVGYGGSGTVTNEYLAVTSAGNVGISNTNPTAKLDVRGSVNSEHAVFTGGTNSNRALSIQTAASGGQQDAGVIFDAQDTEGGANPYVQIKAAGSDVAKFSKGSTDKYSYNGGGIGGNGANLHLDGDDSEIRMANNIIHSDNSGNTKFSIRTGYGATSNAAELSLDGGHITFNAGTTFDERAKISDETRNGASKTQISLNSDIIEATKSGGRISACVQDVFHIGGEKFYNHRYHNDSTQTKNYVDGGSAGYAGYEYEGNTSYIPPVFIPYSPTQVYSLSCTLYQRVGTANHYMGVIGYDENFNAVYVDGIGTYQYILASNSNLTAGNFLKTQNAISNWQGSGATDGNKMDEGTVYLRPMLLTNYNGQSSDRVVVCGFTLLPCGVSNNLLHSTNAGTNY